MDDIIAAISAGALIPLVAIFFKKFILDLFFARNRKELFLKSDDGKVMKFMMDLDSSEVDLKNILESELVYEDKVRRSIYRYMKNNKELGLNLREGKHVDFLLEGSGAKIGIEAKSSIDNFNAEWLKDYFETNSSIDELIFVANSKITEPLLKEVESMPKKYKLKFISSPNGRNLNNTLENVLDFEFHKNNHKKAS